MSNESTTSAPAEQTQQDTRQLDPIAPPTTQDAYAAEPPTAPAPAPGDDGIRWSAKKTAVTAGLAIVLASAGAIGAAAAMPAGSTGGETGLRGPGARTFQFPGGQQNQNGPQLPNLQNGAPGGGLGAIDPNQLSQLDPQDLLQQLSQGIDPFSGGSISPRSGGADGSGQGDIRTT